jgi:hypothetical protein
MEINVIMASLNKDTSMQERVVVRHLVSLFVKTSLNAFRFVLKKSGLWSPF